MKKFTFALMLAAIMLFAALPVLAEGMMFGVKAGLDLANLTGDDISMTKVKTGVVGGVFLSYNITEIFAIQPELLFAMKGAGIDIPIIDASVKANYIEIPILFKVNFPTEGKIKPSLYAGPALGILMSANAEVLGASVDIKDYVKSTNFGLVGGAGIGYEMENRGLLFLEARYDIGLSTVAKDNLDLSFGDEEVAATKPDVKTSDISIMVGYGFPF